MFNDVLKMLQWLPYTIFDVMVFVIKIFRGCLASSYRWGLPNIVKHCLQFCSHLFHCQVLDEAFNKIAESGDLTLERYKDLYAQFLGNPDESCLACNLFGPLPTLWTLLTPLLTKICNPLAQGFYQKYFSKGVFDLLSFEKLFLCFLPQI